MTDALPEVGMDTATACGDVRLVDTPDAKIDETPLPSLGFRAGPPLNRARFFHSSMVLDDGRLLVAGGFAAHGEYVAEVEVYDPSMDRWAIVARWPEPEYHPYFVTKLRGRPLLFGSGTGGIVSYFLDVATGVFTAGPDTPNHPPEVPQIVTLPDGRLFAIAQGDTNAVVYQPAADTWSATFETDWQSNPFPIVTSDGRVVVLHDMQQQYGDHSVDVYDPAIDRWTKASPTPFAPASPSSAVALADGRILLAGIPDSLPLPLYGFAPTSFATLDTRCGAWASIEALPRSARSPRSVQLPSGKILVANGNVHYPTSSYDEANVTAIYDVVMDRWTMYAPLQRSGLVIPPSVDVLPTGAVVVAGGAPSCGRTCSAAPVADTWILDRAP